MALSSRIAKMFTKAEVDKMDTAAKKMSGSPGYDDDTMAAQKEFAKEKKVEASKKLTKAEEKAADKEAYASAMGKDKPKAKKGPMSAKEKKDMQDSLDFNKGGAVKKMMDGGMAKKTAYKKGGYVMMNKGGMGMANCGASVPATQKGKK